MTNQIKNSGRMITLVIAMLVSLFIGANAQANVIDASPFMDKVSTNVREFHPRETGEITIEMSEKNGHFFKPGDELIFTLPKELKGFGQKLWLGDFAQVRVLQDRVTVKFTGKIHDRKNTKIKISFGVKGSEDVTRGSHQNVPLHLGTAMLDYPRVVVHGYPEEVDQPQGDIDFAYKGGNVNENDARLIDWYIVVNPMNLELDDDIFVRDVLGFGHELIPSSIKIDGESVSSKQGTLTFNNRGFNLSMNKDFANRRGVGIFY